LFSNTLSFDNIAVQSSKDITITVMNTVMKNVGIFLLIAVFGLACGDDDDAPPVVNPIEFSESINSGGAAFTFDGTDWLADKGNDASDTFENIIDIEGTENDGLYQTEVFDMTGFTYEVAVPAEGPWEVKLHFAEIFHGVENANGVGARVFSVDIEGQASLTDYDIIDQAGGAATAVVETFPGISVMDGNLTITFTTVTDAAKVNGIEVSGTYIP
jgi:hypothetical protein